MPTPAKGPRLGGSPAHERLILSNLATALFEHGKITTTETKAKRLRPFAEKLITSAKKGTLHSRREVMRVIRDKDVVHKLFAEIGPSFATREGGYTRITKTGPRKGDNASMAIIELIDEETVSSAASREARRAASRRAAARTAATASAPASDALESDAPASDATAADQASTADAAAAAAASASAAPDSAAEDAESVTETNEQTDLDADGGDSTSAQVIEAAAEAPAEGATDAGDSSDATEDSTANGRDAEGTDADGGDHTSTQAAQAAEEEPAEGADSGETR